MPNLDKYMTKEGTTFKNYFVHIPICCPSRSTILSGRYFQNHRVFNNSYAGNCDGSSWQNDVENFTIGVYAQQAGYRTGYSGKYLNTYATQGQIRVPPGWDKWLSIVGNSQYYNYNVIQSDDRGASFTKRRHRNNYTEDYFSNVVARRTLDMIQQFTAQDTQSSSPHQPFFIVNAWPAPHDPRIPAPWALGRFKNTTALRTPNWNASEIYNQQKHWIVRRQSPIRYIQTNSINFVHQRRLETLLSVDQHIEQFVSLLKARGVLNNTIIIYTSDNGYNLGQHRIINEKSHLYEHDIRVPFIVRGPHIPMNASSFDVVVSIDIAPTIYQLIQNKSLHNQSIPLPDTMDGMSFLPIALDTNNNMQQRRHEFLVTYHGEGKNPCGLNECPAAPADNFHYIDCRNNTYHCLRAMVVSNQTDFTYCEFEDDESFVEYYNNSADPWQLQNKHQDLSVDEKQSLKTRLAALKTCRGEECRAPWQYLKNAGPLHSQASTSAGCGNLGCSDWVLASSLLFFFGVCSNRFKL